MDVLEQLVLEQIAEILSDPQRIMQEARRFNKQHVDQSRLEAVNQELGQIEAKQRRLAKLYVDGSIPEDILSQESQPLSRRREYLESELRSFQPSIRQVVDLSHWERNLPSVAARLPEWVLAATDGDLELILKALAIQVKASPQRVCIEGAVPVLQEDQDLVTTVQTSAYMCQNDVARIPIEIPLAA